MAAPLKKGRIVKHVWSADGRLVKVISKQSLEPDNSLNGVGSADRESNEGGRQTTGAFRRAPRENSCLFELMH